MPLSMESSLRKCSECDRTSNRIVCSSKCAKKRFSRRHHGYFSRKQCEYEIRLAARDSSFIARKAERIKRIFFKNRLAVLMAYGGLICRCDHGGVPCGPKPFEFLAVDHIGGNGKRHEKSTQLIYRLIREGFPPGYRPLCHNCNLALGFYGRCPFSKTEVQVVRRKKM